MSEGSLKGMLAFAAETATEAGKLLRAGLGSERRISKKGRINLVTDMDFASERLIVGRIRQRFPDHQILAEEKGSRTADSPFKWVVDPLDGTTNYAHAYRFFCVSIALEAEGEIVLGVVYDPVTEELFSAARDQSACLNGSPIQVSHEDSLGDSLLCTGFSYQEAAIRENLKLFNRLMFRAQALRRDGSAALDLCYVACGRLEAFWELSLNPWDVAAGKFIVEQAGGRVTSFRGDPCTIYDAEILASNGKLHEPMMEALTAGGEAAGGGK
ncbi:MAG: inositol monophosphatase family protein [Acidobacteriota bacterium]